MTNLRVGALGASFDLRNNARVFARVSQTTVYDTILTGHARPTPDRSGPKCHLSHSGCWLDVKSPSHK